MEKKCSTKNSAKQLNIPVKETVLASENGFNGVLVQKALPSFWVFTKKGDCFKVPPIPMDELNRANGKEYLAERKIELAKVKGKKRPQDETDYIWAVFEKYLRQIPDCPKDVSFLKKAAKTFYVEFMYMDLNNLHISNMLRAALKNGVRFIFLEEGAKADNGSTMIKSARAQFCEEDNALEFSCLRYNDVDSEQNTLAHELSHYIINLNKNGFFGTLVKSDVGNMLAECLKMEAFFGYYEWKNAIKAYQKHHNPKNKFTMYGVEEFFFALAEEQKQILHFFDIYKDLEERREEMFARMMGLLAQGDGLKMLSRDDPKRFGVQMICDLAGAKANGNKKMYDSIVKVLKEHRVDSDLKSKIIDFNAVKSDIIETRKYTLNNRFRLQKMYYDLCTDMKTECKKIHKEIQDEYKKGLSAEQIILRRQTAKRASNVYDGLVRCTMFTVQKDNKISSRIDVINHKIEKIKQIKKQRRERNKFLASDQPLEYPIVVYNKNANVLQKGFDKQHQ